MTEIPKPTKSAHSKPKASKHKVATIASAILWGVSIGLSFAIPPENSLIWLPDSVLLIGFVPLLFVWRWSWPWLVFGVLNAAIGFCLLNIELLPDAPFPKELWAGKHHLKDYHPCWSWMIIGALCTIYGIIRMIKNIALMIINKIKNGKNPSC